MRTPWLLLGCGALAVSAPSVSAGDPAFPRETFKHFERSREPVPSEAKVVHYDTAIPGLEIAATATGALRPLSAAKRAYLAAVMQVVGKPALADSYHQEIEVLEQGRAHWLPIQDPVLGVYRAEVAPGQAIGLRLRYLGASGELGRVYAAIDFVASAPEPIPRSSCFRSDLAGVQLGEPWLQTLARLEQQYGPPFHGEDLPHTSYRAFVLDREHESRLIVANAGASYPARVHSVQVTGPPNPALELHSGLRLGALPEAVRQVLGPSTAATETGEGYTRLDYADSPCSAELRAGVLASLRIAADPYYFAE